jgi:hypothetical protein
MILVTLGPSIFFWKRLLAASTESEPARPRAAAATA